MKQLLLSLVVLAALWPCQAFGQAHGDIYIIDDIEMFYIVEILAYRPYSDPPYNYSAGYGDGGTDMANLFMAYAIVNSQEWTMLLTNELESQTWWRIYYSLRDDLKTTEPGGPIITDPYLAGLHDGGVQFCRQVSYFEIW